MINKPLQSANLKTITAIKKKMKQISATELAFRLQYSRRNLYKHLDEEDAEKANVEELGRISLTIDKMIEEEIKEAEKLSNKIS